MSGDRAMRRKCPVPMCGEDARAGHLLCRSCWGAVPADVQRQVNRTWRTMRTALRQRAPDLRRHLADYRQASDAAVIAAITARP